MQVAFVWAVFIARILLIPNILFEHNLDILDVPGSQLDVGDSYLRLRPGSEREPSCRYLLDRERPIRTNAFP